MRYIKSYKIFESNSEISISDIKDICFDLNDDGVPSMISDTFFNKDIFPAGEKSIIFNNRNKNSVILPWISLKETALRLKDYLGDSYISFSFSCSASPSDYKKVRLGHIELDDSTEINDDVYYMIIYYKDSKDFQRIKYSGTNESDDLIELRKLIGTPIKMNENDITSIDDMLEPHKDYTPGKHSREEEYISRVNLFGRSVVEYPPIKTHMNSRSGYTWFLEDPNGDVQYRSHGVKLEVLINKFNNEYYIVHIDHNTNSDDFYLVSGLEQLKRLIKERVLSLY